MIPVLFVVTILVFSIIRFIPGEPARLILGEKATEEAVAALTEKLGLNEPLLTQYLLFLKQIFTLDFGNSFTYQMPVSLSLRRSRNSSPCPSVIRQPIFAEQAAVSSSSSSSSPRDAWPGSAVTSNT